MIVASPGTLSAPSPLFLVLSSRRPIVVSAKLQPGRRRSSPEENIRAVGFAVRTAIESDRLKSSEPRVRSDDSSANKRSTGDDRCLSGSDVLVALQKAAVRKSRKRNIEKPRSIGEVAEEGEEVNDYSNVRPINIREDWVSRLDELDKALEELQKLEA